MMRVLIVDANPSMRRILRELLSGTDADIRVSFDGKDAVEQFHLYHPDVVVMDVFLPRMNGIEAARRIRDIDPAARIIIATDCNSRLMREEAFSTGVLNYFLKDNLLPLEEYLLQLSATNFS